MHPVLYLLYSALHFFSSYVFEMLTSAVPPSTSGFPPIMMGVSGFGQLVCRIVHYRYYLRVLDDVRQLCSL